MRTDIESKINEAEVCRSMGLYDDSLDIYESVLSIVGPQDADVQATIQKRINLLKNEISEQKEAHPIGVDTNDILISELVSSGKGDVPEILDSAAAFQEMGLHMEAIAEYEKLLKGDYPNEKLIPLITESLLKLHSPAKAVKEFNKLVSGQISEETTIGRIKFLLGQEFEKRDHRDQAHDLYMEASRLEPSDAEIKKR